MEFADQCDSSKKSVNFDMFAGLSLFHLRTQHLFEVGEKVAQRLDGHAEKGEAGREVPA